MAIIILLMIGIALIFINIKVIKNDNKGSFEDKLNDISYGTEDYKFEIGKLRKEFGETIFELQKEIEYLKDEVATMKNLNSESNEKVFSDDNNSKRDLETNNKVDVVVDNDIEVEDSNEVENLKAKQIKKLMQDGLSTDEISQKLNIGKGEVLLIQKLYIQ
ncbi:DUF6115 domain-containing protein [Clostridium neuense]|uniref:DUF6115 domain-containing protein n=1 Tax=Clostridium neuense TaxID=1728934 RepID=A0ABW8TJE5_9CLOT